MHLQEQKRTAHHEAGHAVIRLANGLDFHTLTIIPDTDSIGRVRWSTVMDYDVETKRERRAIARSFIIALYAGFEAERQYDPAADATLSANDDDAAFEISQTCGVLPRTASYVGDDVHIRYLNRLRAEARKLVRIEWPKIVYLAEALLAGSGTMTRAEVEALLACRFPVGQRDA